MRDLHQIASYDMQTQDWMLSTNCPFVPSALEHVKVAEDICGERPGIYHRRPSVSIEVQARLIRKLFGKQEIEVCGYKL